MTCYLFQVHTEFVLDLPIWHICMYTYVHTYSILCCGCRNGKLESRNRRIKLRVLYYLRQSNVVARFSFTNKYYIVLPFSSTRSDVLEGRPVSSVELSKCFIGEHEQQ